MCKSQSAVFLMYFVIPETPFSQSEWKEVQKSGKIRHKMFYRTSEPACGVTTIRKKHTCGSVFINIIINNNPRYQYPCEVANCQTMSAQNKIPLQEELRKQNIENKR